MGRDVWPVLVGMLHSSDRFARNGAAEVSRQKERAAAAGAMRLASERDERIECDMAGIRRRATRLTKRRPKEPVPPVIR